MSYWPIVVAGLILVYELNATDAAAGAYLLGLAVGGLLVIYYGKDA